ncbi:hypothetical protein HDU96_000455 [Phlyctochytrium bullatum]|nr:hypothetical protein HDU96_000455 [Phlyctochytrium bullatum]
MASSLTTTAPFRPATTTAATSPTPVNDCGVLADAFPALQLPSSSDNPRICCTGELTPDVALNRLENAIYCRGDKIVVFASMGRWIGSSIPPTIARLDALQHLQLSSANLTGTIPPAIGSMTSLVRLGLFNNTLSGGIPKELGNLRNLTSLGLGLNNLSGAIPRELGNLRNLNTLIMMNNTLSGEVPRALGELSLEYLDLSFNFLNGTAPIAFSGVEFSWIGGNCFSTVENKTGYSDSYSYARPVSECNTFYGISSLPASQSTTTTTTVLATSAPATDASPAGPPVAAIVGGVVGALVVVAVVAFFVLRGRRSNAKPATA